jgi:hypothetical protein
MMVFLSFQKKYGDGLIIPDLKKPFTGYLDRFPFTPVRARRKEPRMPFSASIASPHDCLLSGGETSGTAAVCRNLDPLPSPRPYKDRRMGAKTHHYHLILTH